MTQYRKKPVVVDAEQFWPDKPLPFGTEPVVCFYGTGFYVETIHNQVVRLEPGDWVLRDPRGLNRAYPCKPDVFAATYERVEREREEASA